MAFLTKYRKYSGKTVKDQEEVEYNYGRAFHGIGMSITTARLVFADSTEASLIWQSNIMSEF